MSDLDLTISRALGDLLREARSVERQYFLKKHPSAVPICPRAWWMYHHAPTDRLPSQEQSFMLDYYGKVGTATHELWQKWLSRLGVLRGLWECPSIPLLRQANGKFNQDCVRVFSSIGSCPGCGKELIYKEFKVYDPKTGASGRVDGILDLKALLNQPTSHNIIFELKSIEAAAYEEIEEAKEAHTFQSCYYHVLMNEKALGHGVPLPPDIVPVNGVAIVYTVRGQPLTAKAFWIEGVVAEHTGRLVRDHLCELDEVLTSSEAPIGFCEGYYPDKYCPWGPICTPPGFDSYAWSPEVIPAKSRPYKAY